MFHLFSYLSLPRLHPKMQRAIRRRPPPQAREVIMASSISDDTSSCLPPLFLSIAHRLLECFPVFLPRHLVHSWNHISIASSLGHTHTTLPIPFRAFVIRQIHNFFISIVVRNCFTCFLRPMINYWIRLRKFRPIGGGLGWRRGGRREAEESVAEVGKGPEGAVG